MIATSDRFHMSPTDRGHVAKASPTVTIIWKPGLNYGISRRDLLAVRFTPSFAEFIHHIVKVPGDVSPASNHNHNHNHKLIYSWFVSS